MNDLVAKRYVKALINGRDGYTISTISAKLNSISSAFLDEKFVSIITSPEVANNAKVDLIISIAEGVDNALFNFIRLLGEKRRLTLLPYIANELSVQISKMNNSYTGVIYTNQELSYDSVVSIADQFSRKFNVALSLSQNVCDYDGIKVDIDGLGVEISFSKDRLKTQLVDHILKAV